MNFLVIIGAQLESTYHWTVLDLSTHWGIVGGILLGFVLAMIQDIAEIRRNWNKP